ncbi:hypothetical protein KM043_002766 [Ampulex compressa]|nr:hypothetical protein KM043_002766 [Ampulex compressa]
MARGGRRAEEEPAPSDKELEQEAGDGGSQERERFGGGSLVPSDPRDTCPSLPSNIAERTRANDGRTRSPFAGAPPDQRANLSTDYHFTSDDPFVVRIRIYWRVFEYS